MSRRQLKLGISNCITNYISRIFQCTTTWNHSTIQKLVFNIMRDFKQITVGRCLLSITRVTEASEDECIHKIKPMRLSIV